MKHRSMIKAASILLLITILLGIYAPAAGSDVSTPPISIDPDDPPYSSVRIAGDLTGDGKVDMADVILLLQHCLFPELYPVSYPGSLDFTEDGTEDIGDVILLLQHSLFPSIYTIKDPEPEQPQEPYVYKHVVILGVDGGGSFFQQASTPNLDRIFENGAVNYQCQCMEPSSSNPCWGSLLHGVLPSVHGRTNDSKGPFPSDSPYPSIFRVVREADPDCNLASFNNWDTINKTLLENNLRMFMFTAVDDVLTDFIVNYLDMYQPKLMFVQFDSADAAGHSSGYGSTNHLKTISEIDSYIGRIYDKMVEIGMMEDTLLIVTADHGGTPEGDHGGTSKAEMEIMIAVAGKTVIPGKMGFAELVDIPAIVLHALDLDMPETYTSRLPSNLFPAG